MKVSTARVKGILTRTTGYLKTVASHSFQPYRGCSFGRSLCGVGCYVQHNRFVTRGAPWGSFLEARVNASEVYLDTVDRERRYARSNREAFAVFLSSSTDPFVPHEQRFQITRSALTAMVQNPPDVLILQTHSHRVSEYQDLYAELAANCALRFHLSIESDRDTLPGLPPPASSVAERLRAASALKAAGHRVVITVSPLFPIENPHSFFQRIAEVADAAVIDHFIGGDGTPAESGARTLKTALPGAMAAVDPRSTTRAYRDEIVEVAQAIMPGRVGISIDGFAGRFLTGSEPSNWIQIQ